MSRRSLGAGRLKTEDGMMAGATAAAAAAFRKDRRVMPLGPAEGRGCIMACSFNAVAISNFREIPKTITPPAGLSTRQSGRWPLSAAA
jgi:hypothetical protein